MSQTVTQKQCTESKTGLGAQVHTQWTLAGARCSQAAHTAPRQRAHCSMSQAQHRPYRRRVAPCRAPARLCRGLSWDTPSGQVARCVANHKAAPSAAIQFVSRLSLASLHSCHDTNDCIVTHLSGQAALLSRYN